MILIARSFLFLPIFKAKKERTMCAGSSKNLLFCFIKNSLMHTITEETHPLFWPWCYIKRERIRMLSLQCTTSLPRTCEPNHVSPCDSLQTILKSMRFVHFVGSSKRPRSLDLLEDGCICGTKLLSSPEAHWWISSKGGPSQHLHIKSYQGMLSMCYLSFAKAVALLFPLPAAICCHPSEGILETFLWSMLDNRKKNTTGKCEPHCLIICTTKKIITTL